MFWELMRPDDEGPHGALSARSECGRSAKGGSLCETVAKGRSGCSHGPRGKARDLLEAGVTIQRETVLAWIRGWWRRLGEVMILHIFLGETP